MLISTFYLKDNEDDHYVLSGLLQFAHYCLMKRLLLINVLFVLFNLLEAQPQYVGALERYKLKSDKAVREGLIGEYYSGSNFDNLVRIRQDKEIYFDWDYSNPIPELSADYFSIRWRGKVFAKKEGKHIFTVYTDDGMRVWLNGRLIINAWKDQPPTLYEALVILEKERFYDIRVDYYQKQYQTTAAVFFNHEEEDRTALNASNTVFGKDLEASTAKFDFWEKPGIMEEFWSWMGFTDEKEPKAFVDQSYKVEKKPIEKITAPRLEQTAETEPGVLDKVIKEPADISEENELPQKLELSQNNSLNKYEKMAPGETLVIENIYFDQGKAKLREASFKELNKLLIALQHHPQWSIKIDGHTDNVGFAALNLELSYDRARAVYFYLINKGIDKSRLQFEGFGSRNPIAKNDSEANRQKNRRVEVSLIEEGISTRF